MKIALDSFGSFLGRGKGCLVVKDREGTTKRYPLSENEIAEIRIKSGNTVSAGALATCGFWGIDCLILTRWGNPIAIVKSLVAESHVETRICQYEALTNEKGLEIAKQIVLAKIRGYNEVLKKYGLRSLDYCRFSQAAKELEGDLDKVRNRLMSYQGKYSQQYFTQILGLFKENFRPHSRKTYKAYDGINNVLNLAYSVLFWKIQLAVHKARLEPYLGFLHHVQWSLPSLILDLQEIYRYIADDFVVDYARKVKDGDFILSMDNYAGRKGKREFLNSVKRKEFLDSFDAHFDTMVEIPRIRRGGRQQIETLITEEVLLLAQFLRNEKNSWHPRIVDLS